MTEQHLCHESVEFVLQLWLRWELLRLEELKMKPNTKNHIFVLPY